MTKKPDDKTPYTADKDISRREALKELSKLTVYSAPTVTTLLTAQLSYAQTSEAINSNNNQVQIGVRLCQRGFLRNLGSGLGNDSGWSSANDTTMDCNR